MCPDHDGRPRGEQLDARAHQMAKPPAHGVSGHCTPDGAADHQPDSGGLIFGRLRVTNELVHDNRWPRRTRPPPNGATEVLGSAEPVVGRQHVGQAVSRTRPLDRRDFTIERPARVRIRTRKPWVLARLRLFGWKVRFTSGLHGVSGCVACQGGPAAKTGGGSYWAWVRLVVQTPKATSPLINGSNAGALSIVRCCGQPVATAPRGE